MAVKRACGRAGECDIGFRPSCCLCSPVVLDCLLVAAPLVATVSMVLPRCCLGPWASWGAVVH
eukprot:227397-Alexandrium_andersonii.AAC.1